MTERRMRRLVAQIPDTGSWSTSAGDDYQSLAGRLREFGVSAEDVVEILTYAYQAAQEEVRDGA